jgi:YHS domain-containing protein
MAMMKDPVCGMELDSSQAAAQSQYQGQTYYFCSVECKQKFDANPKQFLKAS